MEQFAGLRRELLPLQLGNSFGTSLLLEYFFKCQGAGAPITADRLAASRPTAVIYIYI
jgi:hypothetical protein